MSGVPVDVTQHVVLPSAGGWKCTGAINWERGRRCKADASLR